MSQPPQYNREKDFTVNDGDDTDHAALNREFDGAAQSINAIRDNLALIQKDDGTLANGIVTADSLSKDAFDAYQGELNQKVREAQEASAESTRSAVASAESAARSGASEGNAAISEANAAASAENAAGAAKAMIDAVYYGSHAEDPERDPNGELPTDGDFYFNNVAKLIRTYDGESGTWVSATPSGQFKRKEFKSGEDFTPGTTNQLTIGSDPGTSANIFVHFDAAYQMPGTYARNGQTLVFDAPIPVGVKAVEVSYLEAVVFPSPRALLVYPDYSTANNAAKTLPDGQVVAAGGSNYLVLSGALVPQRPSASVAEVGTIAELRALAAPKTKCTIYVRGYHSENDGGGGHFLWVPASSKADNGGNVIAPSSSPVSGRWEWDGAIDVRRFGAQLNAGDSTDAIRAAIKTGKKVIFDGIGDYYVYGEIEVTQVGQVIEWAQTGGYGYGTTSGALPTWKPLCQVKARGVFAKRVRTRRLHRANLLSAQDEPLSVVFNSQAEGVHWVRPAIDLYCDYTDTSPTNEGDDCDIAIFLGTRVGVQIHDPIITGYFRRYGILHDFTGATNLPRFPDLQGNSYPESNVNNGGDGAHIFNPYIRGPRVNIGVIGALPAVGQTTYGPDYFDAILGTAVPDARGTFGHSDYLCIGGRLYGPDHHSGWRRKDPNLVGGVLTLASLESEPDNAPCCLHIDGMAGNASGGAWGMRFIGTRFATFEALRIRLGRASRITFFGCHTEARNGSGLSATGQPIDTNNTVSISYGDIAATGLTGTVRALSTNRQGISDGLGNHFYGLGLNVETDSGRYEIPAGGFIQSVDDIDLRSDTGVFTLRQGNNSIGSVNAATGMTLKSGRYAASEGEIDLRSATGQIARIRSGSTTVATFSTFGSVLTSTIRHEQDNVSSFGNPSFRGSTIYLGSNPVVTSDGREKQQICELVDAERRVGARLRHLIRAFKYNDAVVLKGDSARIHVGWIAQEVKAAFEAEGLDGFEYACLCYDEWGAQPERRDDEGNVIQPRQEAGNRYGVRESQLLTFIISAL